MIIERYRFIIFFVLVFGVYFVLPKYHAVMALQSKERLLRTELERARQVAIKIKSTKVKSTNVKKTDASRMVANEAPMAIIHRVLLAVMRCGALVQAWQLDNDKIKQKKVTLSVLLSQRQLKSCYSAVIHASDALLLNTLALNAEAQASNVMLHFAWWWLPQRLDHHVRLPTTRLLDAGPGILYRFAGIWIQNSKRYVLLQFPSGNVARYAEGDVFDGGRARLERIEQNHAIVFIISSNYEVKI